MDLSWNYAEMSHEAAINGGPDEWIASIKDASYLEGIKEGFEQGVDSCNPLIVGLIGGAIILSGAVFMFTSSYYKKKIQSITDEYEKEASAAEVCIKAFCKDV